MSIFLGSVYGQLELKNSQWKKAISEADTGMQKFALGAKVSAVAAGTAVAAGLAYAVTGASEFQTTMTNVSTLISGDSTDAVKQLGDGILEMTSRVPKSANELGAAAYDVVSAGIKGASTQLTVLEASSKLAVAGLGDTAGATDIMTSAINAFGLDANDAGKISDVLFKTVKNGKTTVDGMSQSFGATAPIVAAAGVSLEEFSAATAALTTTGQPASQAQNSLRQAVVGLMKPTGDMAGLLEKAGYASGEAALKQDGLQKVMEKVKEAAGGNAEELAAAWGSVEALGAATALTGPVLDSYTASMSDMKDGANAVDEAFDKQKETFASQMEIMGNNIEKVRIKIGEKLLPALIGVLSFFNDNFIPGIKAVADAFGSAITWAGDFSDALFGIYDRNKGKFQLLAGAMLLAFGPAFAMVTVQAIGAGIAWTTSAVSAAGSWLVFQLQMVGYNIIIGGISVIQAARAGWAWVFAAVQAGAAWLLQFGLMIARAALAGLTMAASIAMSALSMVGSALMVAGAWLLAFWPVILVIGVLAAAAYLVIRNWDTVKAFMTGLWNGIKAAVSSALNFIQILAFNLVKFFMDRFNEIKAIGLALFNGLKIAFAIMVEIFKVYLNTAKAVFSGVFNGIKTVALFVFNSIRTAIVTAINAGIAVFNFLRGIVSSVFNTARSLASSAFGAISGIVRGAVDTVINTLRGILDWFSGLGGKILGFVTGFGDLLSGAGGALMDGLLGGLKAGWDKVSGFVGGLADKIKGLKGPIPYDKKVLIDNGLALMFGLDRGIRSGVADVYKTVATIAPGIQGAINFSDFASAAAGGPGLVSAGPGASGGVVYNIDKVELPNVKEPEDFAREMQLEMYSKRGGNK